MIDDGVAAVVDHVDETGDAGMEEGGVADHGHGLLLHALESKALGHAVGGRDAGAHADAGVHGRERRQRSERVAADVAGDMELELGKHGVEAAVGTARDRTWAAA